MSTIQINGTNRPTPIVNTINTTTNTNPTIQPILKDIKVVSPQIQQTPPSQSTPSAKPIIPPKPLFLPTNYEQACEWAEEEFKRQFGVVPKIGKTPREPERTKITPEEIHNVQKMMERCLKLYMNQQELIAALQLEDIEPEFVALVWDKLVSQNENFFMAYSTMLKIKEQIMAFNYLVSQQAQFVHAHNLGFFAPKPAAAGASPFATSPIPRPVGEFPPNAPVAPAITVPPRDNIPPFIPPETFDDGSDEEDSDDDFNTIPTPTTTKSKAKRKAAAPKTKAKEKKPKAAAPTKAKSKRAKTAADTPLAVPVTQLPPTPVSSGIQVVPIVGSLSPPVIVGSLPTVNLSNSGRPSGAAPIMVVNSPNFPPKPGVSPKTTPRSVALAQAAAAKPLTPLKLSPIPIITAKPGSVPTATVNITPARPGAAPQNVTQSVTTSTSNINNNPITTNNNNNNNQQQQPLFVAPEVSFDLDTNSFLNE